jgi:hypothetical protein
MTLFFFSDNWFWLGLVNEKYSVNKVEPNFIFLGSNFSLSFPMIPIASLKATGIIGIEDAPVPPNTEPKTNTLAESPAL